jgi:hypothetical protein
VLAQLPLVSAEHIIVARNMRRFLTSRCLFLYLFGLFCLLLFVLLGFCFCFFFSCVLFVVVVVFSRIHYLGTQHALLLRGKVNHARFCQSLLAFAIKQSNTTVLFLFSISLFQAI